MKLTRKDFKIDLSVNKDARTITVTDNGIGMDKEDLENNLGVIASSGSYRFKQEVGCLLYTSGIAAHRPWPDWARWQSLPPNPPSHWIAALPGAGRRIPSFRRFLLRE